MNDVLFESNICYHLKLEMLILYEVKISFFQNLIYKYSFLTLKQFRPLNFKALTHRNHSNNQKN